MRASQIVYVTLNTMNSEVSSLVHLFSWLPSQFPEPTHNLNGMNVCVCVTEDSHPNGVYVEIVMEILG